MQAEPTSKFIGSWNPAHDGLETNVGKLQGVSPVANPPGAVVQVAVNSIWHGNNLESAPTKHTHTVSRPAAAISCAAVMYRTALLDCIY